MEGIWDPRLETWIVDPKESRIKRYLMSGGVAFLSVVVVVVTMSVYLGLSNFLEKQVAVPKSWAPTSLQLPRPA